MTKMKHFLKGFTQFGVPSRLQAGEVCQGHVWHCMIRVPVSIMHYWWSQLSVDHSLGPPAWFFEFFLAVLVIILTPGWDLAWSPKSKKIFSGLVRLPFPNKCLETKEFPLTAHCSWSYWPIISLQIQQYGFLLSPNSVSPSWSLTRLSSFYGRTDTISSWLNPFCPTGMEVFRRGDRVSDWVCLTKVWRVRGCLSNGREASWFKVNAWLLLTQKAAAHLLSILLFLLI